MLIIPDVHGRDFWEDPVRECLGKEHILFLGDYLDPYEDEGIPSEAVFPRFEEILALKRGNPDTVTLLLGNHDLHYVDRRLEGSRYDSQNAIRNKAAILDNAGLFQIAFLKTIGETNVLFTHAGVQLMWLALHVDILDLDHFTDIAWALNSLWWDPAKRTKLLTALSDVSSRRGGFSLVGSPIWNDVDDFKDGREDLPGHCQIFGHTQCGPDPIITDYYACLDCRRAFRLTEEGVIEDFR